MTRKAVVSYDVFDSPQEKCARLMEGLRECCFELRARGVSRERISSELERVANDVEAGDCDG
jgi:hypothetical protein